jgi:hypothetical protein
MHETSCIPPNNRFVHLYVYRPGDSPILFKDKIISISIFQPYVRNHLYGFTSDFHTFFSQSVKSIFLYPFCSTH